MRIFCFNKREDMVLPQLKLNRPSLKMVLVFAGASLVPGKENTMGLINRTERRVQNDRMLVAKFCSWVLSHRSSGTRHLFSSQDAILSLLPCFRAPFCAARFGLHFTLPALPSVLDLSFQPLLCGLSVR